MIKPLQDRVIVKRKDAETKTSSGIIIPDTAKEQPQEGVIIAVGEGKKEDGKRMPLDVKKGDNILFLVINGAPKDFSITTFLPLGPSVTLTASASWFTPSKIPFLASS